uniref:GG13034 n=1 Tax=Drosophila erecta TaxID=7220 RepID=B3P2J9_DROER
MRGEEATYRRTTREKIVLRGNTTIRTVDSTSTYLPVMSPAGKSLDRIHRLRSASSLLPK